MKKILKFWVPVGIIGGVFTMDAYFTSILFIRITHGLSNYVTTDQNIILHFFRVQSASKIITFCLSYYFAFLCSKNRNNMLWFLLLYALAFVSPIFFDLYFIEKSLSMLISTFTVSCFGVLSYLGFDWFNKQKQTQELEKKNLQSELSMLKNQINPHFLFNTLNNIDSLIKKNPDCASQSIIELSEMMRYMIYETNTGKVPLKKELEYIDNYMALQKLQYFNDDLVEYTVTGNPENIEVAPMLFIPFIENAFKHCTNKETKHSIRFSFIIFDDRKILFEAMNIADKTQSISKDKTSGIGLDTVKRRLEILYPKRYSLEIQEKNDLFCVSLMIKIND